MFHTVLDYVYSLALHSPKAHKWHSRVGIVEYTKMALPLHNPLPFVVAFDELAQVVFDCISDKHS